MRTAIIAVLILVLLILICYSVPPAEGFAPAPPTPGWNFPVRTYGSPKPGPTVLIIGGVHGNEPAGADALQRLCGHLDSGDITLLKGQLIIVPGANTYGLTNYVRGNGSWINSDINRNFPTSGPVDPISQDLERLLERADWVLDFHEGWGWHLQNSASIGSTLTSSNNPSSQNYAERAVRRINSTITDPNKWFYHRVNDSCDIGTTLGCYCQGKGIPYILTETTGQNEVQPREVRVAQVGMVLDSVLPDVGIQFG